MARIRNVIYKIIRKTTDLEFFSHPQGNCGDLAIYEVCVLRFS